MTQKLNQLIQLLKEELRFFFSISLGVFLFLLFFQPFSLERFDFNNKLLFVAGLGAIIFLFMVIARFVTPIFIKDYPEEKKNEHLFVSYLGGFLILTLCSVAFAFYLRYVGGISISFFIMFKIVLICAFPLTAFRVNDMIKELKKHNEALITEMETMQKKVSKYEENHLNKTVEISSENYTDRIELPVSEIVYVKSADNYVEVVFNEENTFKKKLLRNTLKNIEYLLRLNSNFIRCHRICIVNINYIVRLNRSYSKNWLTIKGTNEELPVSRQYLLKLKEVMGWG